MPGDPGVSCLALRARTVRRRLARVARTYSREAPGRARVSTGEHEDDADHGSEHSLHDLETCLPLLLLYLSVAREHDGVPLDVARARPATVRLARSLPLHECLARWPLPLHA